ncbi:MAG: natural resistance-associated macrophage protein metal ion transporter [Rhodospirillales bacterium]|nr:natural resistance-associated macrophage protein metal ion transporter [Rhodospirillales bacterium]
MTVVRLVGRVMLGLTGASARGSSWARRATALFGPAALVAVGYMDPGNWATDLAGGSAYGYRLLSVVLAASLLAIPVQILAARLGIASGRDLASCCREFYPRPVSLSLWLLAEIAIAACDLAELIGVALALNLLFGLPILAGVLIGAADAIFVLQLQNSGFSRLEAYVLALMAVIGACLGIEILWAPPDAAELFAGFIPHPEIIRDPAMLYLAIGIVGATVMPHNLYLQSWLVSRKVPADERAAIRTAAWTTTATLLLAFLVNGAILVVAAAAFHSVGRTDVADIRDAYALLTPLAGVVGASSLFAIALLASGVNATFTGTLAGQIVMEGFLELRMKPWRRRLITRLAAVVPTLFVIAYSGDGAIGGLLVLSQVLLSVQLPFALVPLLHFAGARRIMGDAIAPRWLLVTGWTIASALIVIDAKLVFYVIMPS